MQVVPRIQAKWLFPEWQVSACSKALLSRWLASPLRQKCLLKNYDAGQREASHTPKGTQSHVNMVGTAYPGYMDQLVEIWKSLLQPSPDRNQSHNPE